MATTVGESLATVIGRTIVSSPGFDLNRLRAFTVLEECTIVFPRDLDRDLVRDLSFLARARDLLSFGAGSLEEGRAKGDNCLTPTWRTIARNEIVTATSPYKI
jgi:hypothetical protein